MLRVRVRFALPFTVSVWASLAGAQPAQSEPPCAGQAEDFAPCLAVIEDEKKAVDKEKARFEDKDLPAPDALIAREKRIQAALVALTDLAARNAKLADFNAQLQAAEDRRAAARGDATLLAYEELLVQELKQQGDAVKAKLDVVRPGAFRYAQRALEVTPRVAQDDSTSSRPTDRVPSARADCQLMIARPRVGFDVSECPTAAMQRSAVVIPGGEIKVPGSVLNPPGLSAVLSGSESGGSVSLALTQEIKRRFPFSRRLLDQDATVQRTAVFAGTIGLRAGEGTLFTRDTNVDTLEQLDNRAAFTAALTANFFSGESKAEWERRAELLADAAKSACRSDQQQKRPQFLSTCEGESLTDWVYALGPNGVRLNEKIADQADKLYYGGNSAIPRWGLGVNVEMAHASYPYILPADFTGSFGGDFNDPVFKAAFRRLSHETVSLSPYGFVRLTDADARFGLSLIPSYTIAMTLGYPNGYEKPLFCPPLATGAPFSTAGCRRFYGAAPTFARVQTFGLEARSAFTIWGGIDLIASPKISWNDKDRTLHQPWLLSLPLLAFTDASKTSAVGARLEWAFGQIDAAGLDKDDGVVVKLIYQKNFSLTGQ
jgi:hypothetical protein